MCLGFVCVMCLLLPKCYSEVSAGNNVTVTEGEDVRIHCPGGADDVRTAWWKENDRVVFHGEVTPEFKAYISFDSTTGDLTIREAKMNYSGEYSCQVDVNQPRIVVHVVVIGEDNAGELTHVNKVGLLIATVIITIITVIAMVFIVRSSNRTARRLRRRLRQLFRCIFCNSIDSQTEELPLREWDIFHPETDITAEKSFTLAFQGEFSENGTEVKGLAYLEGKIYVIQGTSISIKVFTETSENSFSEKNPIESDLFIKLVDIVACKAIMALYILDQSCIWQLDKNGNITEYVRLSHVYATISVTGRHLLVTSSSDVIKCRYRGILKPSLVPINFPMGLSGTKPWHALETGSWNTYVAHIEKAKFHRVSKLEESERNRANIELCAYGYKGGNAENQLSNPVYLALERQYGHVFVADHDNGRVVMLDSDLRRRLMISDLTEGCYPNRLCYVEDKRTLIVGMSNGLVIGYKFTRQTASPETPLVHS